MKMLGKNVQDQNYCQKVWKMEKTTTMGGHDLVRRMDRQGEVPDMVQKVFGIRQAKNAGQSKWIAADRNRWGTEEFGKMLKRIQTLEDGRVPAKEATTLEDRRTKKESPERSIRGL